MNLVEIGNIQLHDSKGKHSYYVSTRNCVRKRHHNFVNKDIFKGLNTTITSVEDFLGDLVVMWNIYQLV